MVDEHEDDEEEDTEKSAEERKGWKEKRQPSPGTGPTGKPDTAGHRKHDFRMGIRNSIWIFRFGGRERVS